MGDSHNFRDVPFFTNDDEAEYSSLHTRNDDITPSGEVSFKCSVCFCEFSDKEQLADHLQVHFKEVAEDTVSQVTEDSETPSAILSDRGRGEKARTKCIDTHSDVTPHKCPVCSQCFVSSEGRDRHMKIHGGVKSYECNVCKQLFFSSPEYRRHINTHGDNPVAKPFECSKCDKRFLTNRAMKLHMRTHEDKTLVCAVCERNFLSSYHLNIHMMTHDGVTPLNCPQCRKKFCNEGDLRKHLKSHQEVEPFECMECGKPFNNQSALNGHMRTHKEKIIDPTPIPPEDEKPVYHECEECGKSFLKIAHLMEHRKSHVNEKSFFDAQSSSHSNGEIYECRICKKSFGESGHLGAHMRTHTAEEQYRCFVSDERFRQRQIRNKIDQKINPVTVKNIPKVEVRRRKARHPRQTRSRTRASEEEDYDEYSEDDKLFRCFICNENFADKDAVLIHLKSHHQDSEKEVTVPKQEISTSE